MLLLDFANAFNNADRDLMLKLAEAHFPELAGLAHFFYTEESDLLARNGWRRKSSTGCQQGCSRIFFLG